MGGVEFSVGKYNTEPGNLNSGHFDQNTGSTSHYSYPVSSTNRWQAAGHGALVGSQVVLLLAQHRRGKDPTCLHQRGCACKALGTAALHWWHLLSLTHVGKMTEVFTCSRLYHWGAHCSCLARLKVTYRHEIWLPRCAV